MLYFVKLQPYLRMCMYVCMHTRAKYFQNYLHIFQYALYFFDFIFIEIILFP